MITVFTAQSQDRDLPIPDESSKTPSSWHVLNCCCRTHRSYSTFAMFDFVRLYQPQTLSDLRSPKTQHDQTPAASLQCIQVWKTLSVKYREKTRAKPSTVSKVIDLSRNESAVCCYSSAFIVSHRQWMHDHGKTKATSKQNSSTVP